MPRWLPVLMTPGACSPSVILSAGDAAICAGTRQARADHAAAMVVDGGGQSVVTGQRLVAALDAAYAG